REFAIASPDLTNATAERLNMRYDGYTVQPVELLPTRLKHEALIARSVRLQPSTRIVLGLGELELQSIAVDFAVDPHLIVLGEGECGKTSTLRMLCREIVRTNTAESAQLFIIDYRRTLLGVVESDHLGGYLPSAEALTSKMPDLLECLR